MEKAKVGDLITIVSKHEAVTAFKLGGIYEVIKLNDDSTQPPVIIAGEDGVEGYVNHAEYVIHRKFGEEDAPESVVVVSGVGPDAPIVENEFGAKQSKSPYRMELIDAKALLEIAKVHSQGAEKYGDTNWRNISIEDNLNHALVHVYAYLAGDKQDDHLSHAATRMIFALALDLANGQK